MGLWVSVQGGRHLRCLPITPLDPEPTHPVETGVVASSITERGGGVIRTEFGTRAKELIQAIEKGPPYVVHFHWAGGDARSERKVVTEALASCFGVNDLGAVQTIAQPHEALGSLEYRVEYAFWLLR